MPEPLPNPVINSQSSLSNSSSAEDEQEYEKANPESENKDKQVVKSSELKVTKEKLAEIRDENSIELNSVQKIASMFTLMQQKHEREMFDGRFKKNFAEKRQTLFGKMSKASEKVYLVRDDKFLHMPPNKAVGTKVFPKPFQHHAYQNGIRMMTNANEMGEMAEIDSMKLSKKLIIAEKPTASSSSSIDQQIFNQQHQQDDHFDGNRTKTMTTICQRYQRNVSHRQRVAKLVRADRKMDQKTDVNSNNASLADNGPVESSSGDNNVSYVVDGLERRSFSSNSLAYKIGCPSEQDNSPFGGKLTKKKANLIWTGDEDSTDRSVIEYDKKPTTVSYDDVVSIGAENLVSKSCDDISSLSIDSKSKFSSARALFERLVERQSWQQDSAIFDLSQHRMNYNTMQRRPGGAKCQNLDPLGVRFVGPPTMTSFGPKPFVFRPFLPENKPKLFRFKLDETAPPKTSSPSPTLSPRTVHAMSERKNAQKREFIEPLSSHNGSANSAIISDNCFPSPNSAPRLDGQYKVVPIDKKLSPASEDERVKANEDKKLEEATNEATTPEVKLIDSTDPSIKHWPGNNCLKVRLRHNISEQSATTTNEIHSQGITVANSVANSESSSYSTIGSVAKTVQLFNRVASGNLSVCSNSERNSGEDTSSNNYCIRDRPDIDRFAGGHVITLIGSPKLGVKDRVEDKKSGQSRSNNDDKDQPMSDETLIPVPLKTLTCPSDSKMAPRTNMASERPKYSVPSGTNAVEMLYGYNKSYNSHLIESTTEFDTNCQKSQLEIPETLIGCDDQSIDINLNSSHETADVKNYRSVYTSEPPTSLLESKEEINRESSNADNAPKNCSTHHFTRQIDDLNFETSSISCDENEVHYLPDGHFWMEISGIGSESSSIGPSPQASLRYKKPSKVSFSGRSIKVYSTYSQNECDRRNDEIDPVSASAEYELERRLERMDIFDIEIDKGHDGLGFSIIGMGVGADSGLEKLGIFVKSITQDGAVHRDGRINVCDQIIEVDGKSLVGVSQSHAANVLRGTSGVVRFKIGREKDLKSSEVAKLIQRSLEQDCQLEMELQKAFNQSETEMQEGAQGSPAENQSILDRPRNWDPGVVCPAPYITRDQADDGTPEQLIDSNPQIERLMTQLRKAFQHPIGFSQTDAKSESKSFEENRPLSNPRITQLFDQRLTIDGQFAAATDEQNPSIPSHRKSAESDSKNKITDKETFFPTQATTDKFVTADDGQLASTSNNPPSSIDKNKKDHNPIQNSSDADQDETIDSLEKCLAATKAQTEKFQAMLNDSQRHYAELEQKYSKAKVVIKDYQEREKDYLEREEAHLQHLLEKDKQYSALLKQLNEKVISLEQLLRQANERKKANAGSQVSPEENKSEAAPSDPATNNTSPVLAYLPSKKPAPPAPPNSDQAPTTSNHKLLMGHCKQSSVSTVHFRDNDKNLIRNNVEAFQRCSMTSDPGFQPFESHLDVPSTSACDSQQIKTDCRHSSSTNVHYHVSSDIISPPTPRRFAQFLMLKKKLSYSSNKLEYTVNATSTDEKNVLNDICQWSCDDVCKFLLSIGLEKYAPEFSINKVDGKKLVQLDGARLKSIGVQNQTDRTLIKKQIREMKCQFEKDKRAMLKQQKKMVKDTEKKYSTSPRPFNL